MFLLYKIILYFLLWISGFSDRRITHRQNRFQVKFKIESLWLIDMFLKKYEIATFLA